MQPVTDDALGRIERTVLVSPLTAAVASWSIIQMLVCSWASRPLRDNPKELAR